MGHRPEILRYHWRAQPGRRGRPFVPARPRGFGPGRHPGLLVQSGDDPDPARCPELPGVARNTDHLGGRPGRDHRGGTFGQVRPRKPRAVEWLARTVFRSPPPAPAGPPGRREHPGFGRARRTKLGGGRRFHQLVTRRPALRPGWERRDGPFRPHGAVRGWDLAPTWSGATLSGPR